MLSMPTYQARPTAAQIAAGYFILPRKLHQEWKHRFSFHEFDVNAFGKEYTHLRLDQNYRLRVRLKGYIEPGESVSVEVASDRRLVVSRV